MARRRPWLWPWLASALVAVAVSYAYLSLTGRKEHNRQVGSAESLQQSSSVVVVAPPAIEARSLGLCCTAALPPTWSECTACASTHTCEMIPRARVCRGVSRLFRTRIRPWRNVSKARCYVNALPSHALSIAELEQLNRTGFVVAPSLVPRRDSGSALYGIYASDLPVFFSADAALHAFHVTFETGVAALEEHRLKPMLHQLLSNMTSRLQDLAYVCDTKCGVLPPWVIASRVCSCAGGCSLGFVSRLYPSTGCCFTYGSARTTCPRTSSCASHPGCGCVLDCCSLFDGG